MNCHQFKLHKVKKCEFDILKYENKHVFQKKDVQINNNGIQIIKINSFA